MVSTTFWLLRLGLRRARRRKLGFLALVLAFVLTGATAADAVNMHYSYMPRLNDVVGVPTWPTSSLKAVSGADAHSRHSFRRGTVVTVSIAGNVSGFHGTSTFIYLPPEYLTESTQRFPVVYMLHGTPGVPVDWFRAANAASVGDELANLNQPAILVAPPVSKDWLDDSECVDRPSEHIEQYVTNDVVPYVDSTFRTLASRNDRVIAGMSAGGYCALNIGLKHSATFGSIVDMSGYARPTHAAGMTGLFGKSPQLQQLVADNTPADYISTIDEQPQRIWLDSGSSDAAAARDAKQVQGLLSGNASDDVRLTLRPGGHSYSVWRPAMRQSFPWALTASQQQ